MVLVRRLMRVSGCCDAVVKTVTCAHGEDGGDVPALIVGDQENGLTLALVDVAAQLLVRLVARAGRAHAREAAERVAALPACAILEHNWTVDRLLTQLNRI